MRDKHMDIFGFERLNSLAKILQENEFNVRVVKNAVEAKNEILKIVERGSKVGIGGSVTIRQVDVIDDLEKKLGCIVSHHWAVGLTLDEKMKIMKQNLSTDFYLTSANAITLKGEIVNEDMNGNRVGAMMFGPKHTILIVGKNKIVNDIADAILRIRNTAAVVNAKRLNLDLPCAKSGICVDCDSPKRICRITSIISKRPAAIEFDIILVDEDLGY